MAKSLYDQIHPLYEELLKNLKDSKSALRWSNFSADLLIEAGEDPERLANKKEIVANYKSVIRETYNHINLLEKTCKEIDALRSKTPPKESNTDTYKHELMDVLNKELDALEKDIHSLRDFGVQKDIIKLVEKAKKVGNKAQRRLEGSLLDKIYETAGAFGEVPKEYLVLVVCLGILFFSNLSYTGYSSLEIAGEVNQSVLAFVVYLIAIILFVYFKEG